MLLELMKTTANAELLMHTLADFQRLLTSDNLRVLWECPWAEWFSSFIAEVTSSRRPQAAEICHSAYAVVQKIMVYDLHRRNSATARLRGALAEDEDLQFGIVNASIEYFLLNSTLGDDTAQDVLRNLRYGYYCGVVVFVSRPQH